MTVDITYSPEEERDAHIIQQFVNGLCAGATTYVKGGHIHIATDGGAAADCGAAK